MVARRTAGVVAGVLAVGAVAATVTVVDLAKAARGAKPAHPTSVATAEVTQQTLIDRENHDGTLAHGESTTVSARGAGTVTELPAEGTTIARGKALFRLDNQPVTLLYGALPAYRPLAIDVKGVDVKQLEQNLWDLGYRGFTVDETFTASTAAAVKAWQKDLGRTVTGAVDPGQIVYAASDVRVDSLSTQVGAVVGPGAAVEKVTGTAPLVTVALDMSSARLARTGAPVRITLPGGKVVTGTISKVTMVVSPGDNGGAATTKLDVTIQFDAPVDSTGTAAVTVAFTAGERPNVLTVPVTALLALAEGGYGVQVVDGSTTSIVPVDTGLFADGKVEVTADRLKAGMKVAVPS
jgi:peptidoglycan hydrolase-like protein with peptidoglycan-binding domain